MSRSLLPRSPSPLYSQGLSRCSQTKAAYAKCTKSSPFPPQQLTINEDVNPLEFFQCLIHRCLNGLGLPDI